MATIAEPKAPPLETHLEQLDLSQLGLDQLDLDQLDLETVRIDPTWALRLPAGLCSAEACVAALQARQ